MSQLRSSGPDRTRHPGAASARTAAAVSRSLHLAKCTYTLSHGRHQVRVGPVVFWIVVGTLVIMGVWSIGTGTYFAFRENLLTRLIGHEAHMRIAYEDRIAQLRDEIDRITSRQLLNQEEFDQKLDALLQRQARLERRTSTLAGDLLTTGSIPHGRYRPHNEADALGLRLRPKPINNTIIFKAPDAREARLQPREQTAHPIRLAPFDSGAELGGELTRVSDSLDSVAQQQTAIVSQLERHYDSKARHMRNVLDDLGVRIQRARHRDIGGPFVPLKPPPASASRFRRQLYRINIARAHIGDYRRTLVTVPVRKPLPGPIEVNSPFGVRTDPFNGRPEMHTGVDLHAEYGEPVHATAAGTIAIAGWDGGYGNLVQIDHGHGLSTRYGHLSKIEVKVGQRVHIGQVIGRIGSTGRSTGPHLHYETRIDGKPINPEQFLRAGIRLARLGL